MKTLILFLFLFAPKEYDTESDRYVNEIINKGYITYELHNAVTIGKTYYTLRYDEFHIEVIHTEYIQYWNKERWKYYCIRKDGSLVILNNNTGLGVSEKTLARIRNICLELKKKLSEDYPIKEGVTVTGGKLIR